MIGHEDLDRFYEVVADLQRLRIALEAVRECTTRGVSSARRNLSLRVQELEQEVASFMDRAAEPAGARETTSPACDQDVAPPWPRSGGTVMRGSAR